MKKSKSGHPVCARKDNVMKLVSYVFHAMDPASMTFLHLTYGLFVVENSHSVTNEELLHRHTVTNNGFSTRLFQLQLLLFARFAAH